MEKEQIKQLIKEMTLENVTPYIEYDITWRNNVNCFLEEVKKYLLYQIGERK